MIFGWDSDYDRLVENEQVTTLEKRRETLTCNFAKKAAKSDRFAKWFEEATKDRTLRKNPVYKETFARTDRLRNSPLFYMRRALNAIN